MNTGYLKDGSFTDLRKWQNQVANEAIPYFYLNFVENCFQESVIIFVYGENIWISLQNGLKKHGKIKNTY